IVWTFLFILGSAIGSFLNVCVYRLPLREDVIGAWRGLVDPPSSCPYCRRRIWAIDNVPIFGWMMLRGRCRFCRHRISMRYPLVEFLNGALFVGLYIALVPAGYDATVEQSCIFTEVSPLPSFKDQSTASLWLNLQYLYYLVLVEALFVASLIDFDLQIIPDSVTVPAMIVGFLGSLAGSFYLVPVWSQNPQLVTLFWSLFADPQGPPPWWSLVAVPQWCLAYPVPHGFAVSLAGFLVGGGVIWFVRIVGAWVFRREAMGFGDVILMAMIGSFLGWQPTLVVFFLAPICALLVVLATWLFLRSREIPFGPYLSLGALLVIFAWKPLYAATAHFFSLGPFVPFLAALLGFSLIAVLWLVQGTKYLLGIPLYEDESPGEWTSADQLTFFASHQATGVKQDL
ncbi:MAG: hypothetical protein B7Z55_16000, partial [Planctomycetales bacterium 12-60-4]